MMNKRFHLLCLLTLYSCSCTSKVGYLALTAWEINSLFFCHIFHFSIDKCEILLIKNHTHQAYSGK